MGNRQTKVEGDYLPPTPKKCELNTPSKTIETNLDDVFEEAVGDALDPRSPNACRTPIHEVISKINEITRNQDLTTDISPEKVKSDCLRVKLLKNIGMDLKDPRSPSAFINRTPIPNKSLGDKLNDSMVCENFNNVTILSEFDVSTDYDVPSIAEYKQANNVPVWDPRSPSLNVERTPMVFNSDNDSEKLTKTNDLFDTPKTHQPDVEEEEFEDAEDTKDNEDGPVKVTPKLSQIPKNRLAMIKAPFMVHQDPVENNALRSTPKSSIIDVTGSRTPLSCVANKTHGRSKSAENNIKKQLSTLNQLFVETDQKIAALNLDVCGQNTNNKTDENTPTNQMIDGQRLQGSLSTKGRRISRIPVFSAK